MPNIWSSSTRKTPNIRNKREFDLLIINVSLDVEVVIRGKTGKVENTVFARKKIICKSWWMFVCLLPRLDNNSGYHITSRILQGIWSLQLIEKIFMPTEVWTLKLWSNAIQRVAQIEYTWIISSQRYLRLKISTAVKIRVQRLTVRLIWKIYEFFFKK